MESFQVLLLTTRACPTRRIIPDRVHRRILVRLKRYVHTGQSKLIDRKLASIILISRTLTSWISSTDSSTPPRTSLGVLCINTDQVWVISINPATSHISVVIADSAVRRVCDWLALIA
jgi:hypothetical protein